MEICGDNRFEVIEKAKQHLLDSTNIGTAPDEMAVLDNFLFRCWQMGWLDKYDDTKKYISEKECGDCDVWKKLKYIESQDLIRREDAASRIIKYIEDEGFCDLEKPMYVIDMIPRYNWTRGKDCVDK